MFIKEINDLSDSYNKEKCIIKAVKYESETITDFVIPNKNKYIWYFTINNFIHKIELIHTNFKGRRQIMLDNKEIYDSGNLGLFSNDFEYLLKINNIDVRIKELDSYYELFLNNYKFKNLYLKELKLKRQNLKNNNTKDDNINRINEFEKEFFYYIKKNERNENNKSDSDIIDDYEEINKINFEKETFKQFNENNYNPFEDIEKSENDELKNINLNNNNTTPFDF